MINVKDHITGYIFDPWGFLGPKRRKMLHQSWSGLFRDHILNELPVGELAKHYNSDLGRPTKELYAMLGAVLLQQAHDLSDEDTVEQLAFNLQWHYALDITDESDDSKYICPKTLWSVRNLCAEGKVDGQVFNSITAKLAQVFDVDLNKQRMDSVHIQSNMRRLSSIGIFVKAIHKFLVNLKRQHKESFDGLPEELTSLYVKEKSLACFAMVKPSESEKTLDDVAADLYHLVETFAGHDEINSMTTFKQLVRILDERCEISSPRDDCPVPIKLKPAKQISADSLQNPSDPDAGYDRHKGQGYQVQVMETYSPEQDPKKKSQQLNLITYVDAESAARHDVNALGPAIDSVSERDLAPDEILADSHYGSDSNCELAKSKGIEVVSPVIGGGMLKDGLHLCDFEFSDELEPIKCPAGHAPIEVKKNPQRYSAVFDDQVCRSCPHSENCPAENRGSRRRYLRYNKQEVRISKRRAYEATEEFKARYRWRSGVEATMSEIDRLTGIKRLRVRGLKAVRFCVTLKACGLNIFRATRARKARIAANNGPANSWSFVFCSKIFIKELLSAFFTRIKSNLKNLKPNPVLYENYVRLSPMEAT